MTTVRSSSGSGSLRSPDDRKRRPRSDVVAMHRDIDHAGRDGHFFDCLDVGRDPSRQLDAARRNSGQDEGRRSRLRSMISCAIRRSARRIASASKMRTRASCRLLVLGFAHFLRDLAGSR